MRNGYPKLISGVLFANNAPVNAHGIKPDLLNRFHCLALLCQPMFNVYQRILEELESYLDSEINEWFKLSRSGGDTIDIITLEALSDIRREIQRLKRLYLRT